MNENVNDQTSMTNLNNKNNNVLTIIMFVIILLLIGIIVWFMFFKEVDKKNNNNDNNKNNTENKVTELTDQTTINALKKTINNVVLAYPENNISDYKNDDNLKKINMVLNYIDYVDNIAKEDSKATKDSEEFYVTKDVFNSEAVKLFGSNHGINLNISSSQAFASGESCAAWKYNATKEKFFRANNGCGGEMGDPYQQNKYIKFEQTEDSYIVTSKDIFVDVKDDSMTSHTFTSIFYKDPYPYSFEIDRIIYDEDEAEKDSTYESRYNSEYNSLLEASFEKAYTYTHTFKKATTGFYLYSCTIQK